ncbi:MAG TPA: ABC-type transport auxiliary lipoprotein family protein [Fibrobacteria bacterium]|nr:ABC-type transport auxiliary lipoprotein family protein [Fibrobacteria bacterium]HOX53010.1 ABC-type transport auxiliary lipoprotein family protein [Fibrobacteria bacterium]
MISLRRLLPPILACLSLSGCFSGPTQDYRYYVLDYVPTTSKARLAQGPWPTSILVRNFTMGEAYLRPELVYRTSAHEMLYHWQHRWAVKPEQVVSDMSRKHLVEAKVFRTVQDQYDENQPAYELRGRVASLEEYVTQDRRYAHLDLRLTFVRMSDDKVLWSQNFDVRREVVGTEPVYVVRALSSLLEASMDRTIGAIDSVMARESIP